MPAARLLRDRIGTERHIAELGALDTQADRKRPPKASVPRGGTMQACSGSSRQFSHTLGQKQVLTKVRFRRSKRDSPARQDVRKLRLRAASNISRQRHPIDSEALKASRACRRRTPSSLDCAERRRARQPQRSRPHRAAVTGALVSDAAAWHAPAPGFQHSPSR